MIEMFGKMVKLPYPSAGISKSFFDAFNDKYPTNKLSPDQVDIYDKN
jgi:hypothetical protein